MNIRLFALATLAALTSTAVALADEPPSLTPTPTPTLTPIPVTTPTPQRETLTAQQAYRPNRPLLFTGGALLVASYVATAAATRVERLRDASRDQPTYIPVVGPWLHLANAPGATPAEKATIGASGVVQGAGLVLGVMSFFVPERVPAATLEFAGLRVHPRVSMTSGVVLGASGEF